ncbi:hypothetical protein Tco_0372474, partial [Tanacetum coccineum]
FRCLPEWTGAEVQEEPHLDVKPTLQRLPFYCTPHAVAEAVIPDPTIEDLAVGTLVSRLLLRLKLPKSERPLLLVPLRAMLLSALVIPSSGNQGGSFVAPTAEGSYTRSNCS